MLNRKEQVKRLKQTQKLKELKGQEEQLQSSLSKLNAQYELQKATLGENASEIEKLRLKIDNLESNILLLVKYKTIRNS